MDCILIKNETVEGSTLLNVQISMNNASDNKPFTFLSMAKGLAQYVR
jgi:hypothetical protein